MLDYVHDSNIESQLQLPCNVRDRENKALLSQAEKSPAFYGGAVTKGHSIVGNQVST